MEKLFGNMGSVKYPKLPGTLPLDPTRGGGGYSAPVSKTKFGLWILSNLPNSEKSGIFKNNIFEFIKPKPNSFF